jgi:serine/threonine protein phosphatase Stp1
MSGALARIVPPASSYTSVARSHVGNVRQFNEDRLLDRSDRALWAVADGMGGHRGGDIAAELAIEALRALADSDDAIDAAGIRQALEQANAEIFRRGEAVGGVIGSTIVALHIAEGVANLLWAGDSRAYHLRGVDCTQLTTDHSLVQQLVDAGALDAAQASRHPQAHIITRALGAEPTIEIQSLSLALDGDDSLLLCSDGLSRSLVPADLANVRVDEASGERLLAEALARDGADNISFVLIAAQGGRRTGDGS